MKNIIIVSGLAFVLIISAIGLYIFLPKLFISSKDKFTVLMAGQSVTDHWFKRRELPGFLNELSIWRDWHIPYDKHVSGDVYYERLYMPSPRSGHREDNYVYGEKSLKAIESALEINDYDAMHFKFCFIDFGDKSLKSDEQVDEQLDQMTDLVQKVHALTNKHDTKLIIGNALPSLDPGQYGQKLRERFNAWVVGYGANQEDTINIELYKKLANEQGALDVKYSLDPGDNDSHLNQQAYDIMESELTQAISQIK
jgi:hypothetical protein